MLGNEAQEASDLELCPFTGCIGCEHLYVACAGRIIEEMPVT